MYISSTKFEDFILHIQKRGKFCRILGKSCHFLRKEHKGFLDCFGTLAMTIFPSFGEAGVVNIPLWGN